MKVDSKDNESIVGEECHIVSRKRSGPRYDPNYPINKIDSCSNLILLCRNHHKMVDDHPKIYTVDRLQKLKTDHGRSIEKTQGSASSQENQSMLKSINSRFLRVISLMPRLIAEMKKDLTKEENKYIREFFIMSKHHVLNLDPEKRYFVYYFEEHSDLQGKMNILENYGFIKDITSKNVNKYRLTEEFIELILKL